MNNAFCIIIDFVFKKYWQNYNSRKLLKPAGLQLSLFRAYEEHDRSLKVSTSIKFKASGLRKLFFDEKILIFEIFSLSSSKKTRIQQFSSTPLSLEIK